MRRRSRAVLLAGLTAVVAACSSGSRVAVIDTESDDETAVASGAVVSTDLGSLEIESEPETTEAETTTTTAPARTVVAEALVDSVDVLDGPAGAPKVTLQNPIESGAPLVFQVLSEDTNRPWIEVALPIRPNGSTGWIRTEDVELTANPYRIDIDTDAYTLVVSRDGRPILETLVALGTGDTPTPIGEFYIIELLAAPDADGAYGPYAFGLSGYSEVLENFAGGEGVIGIHGTNEPGRLGTDVSHGCIRVTNEVITVMAEQVPLGTPVRIA